MKATGIYPPGERMPDESEQARIEQEALDSFDAYLSRWPTPVRRWETPVAVEWRAEGVWVQDVHGRTFLDCTGGYGVFALGHRHPKVIAAVKEQLDRMPLHLPRLVDPCVALAARRLAGLTPGNLRKTFFCNSGTEAVEGALKLARLFKQRGTFVSTENSFHGKSFGSLSVTGRSQFRGPVGPMMPVRFVPFGDAAALERVIDDDTAAFIVEPIQGEGGIHVPPPGYLSRVREICTRKGILLVVDEIQTGLGRTGRMFACDHEGVVPDILCLAKALSGGVIPCGAFTSTDEIWSAYHPMPLMHTSTFGANPLAAAAVVATLDVLVTERLPERAAHLGERLEKGLRDLWRRFSKMLTDVRGKGLMLGLEFASEDVASRVVAHAFADGLLLAHTQDNARVIRIEPPLIIGEEHLGTLLGKLGNALEVVSR